jgi:O-antigen/teichoic acid export membrane protein
MITALMMGGGLRALSVITLAGTVLGELTRVRLAHLACEGLRVRPSSVQARTVRELLAFGGKTLIPSVSQMLLNQAVSIVIVAYLTPAALALYSRPRSLVYHMYSLVNKMAMVLIPTVSSLQSIGDATEIRELVLRSVRCSAYMALPMVLVLAIFGDAIMHLWMGVHYANGVIPAILALGYLATMAQLPAWNVLMGLNAHGRAGIATLIASLSSVGLAVFSLAYLKTDLAGVALAVVLPLSIMNGLYLPFLTCRCVGISLRTYFSSTVLEPLLRTVPFALCLMVARLTLHSQPLVSVIVSVIVGGAVLAGTYWRHVLPDRIRMRFLPGGCAARVSAR